MAGNTGPSANSVAIAGGAIAVSLIDALIKNGMLTPETARGIIKDAQERIRPHTINPDAQLAAQIVSAIWKTIP